MGIDIDETDPAALERRAHSLYQEALRLFNRANLIRSKSSGEMQQRGAEYMARPRSPLERLMEGSHGAPVEIQAGVRAPG